jgi:putative transcriptional regulator
MAEIGETQVIVLKNTIKVERARRDLTQEDLAKLVGVTRKTINTVERGVYIPSTFLALKIVRAFGAKFEDIFFLEEE